LNGPPHHEGMPDLHIQQQLSTIAWLRWRLFVNALRTTRGKLELLSRIFVALAFSIGGLGGALGMASGAHIFIAEGKPEMLTLLLWPVFIFWQVFPIMSTAFTNNPDSEGLLRFPLAYRSYFAVRLAYGAFDPATALGSLWLLGILFGVAFAKPALLPWATAVLFVFAAFNLLFMQMIFAWVERWLAQRRTRELAGILFILVILSFQLVGPLLVHFGRRARHQAHGLIDAFFPVQNILPPGLAADAIAQGSFSHYMVAFSSMALLCAFVLLVGYCLHVRLLAQSRGENLSEAPAASTLAADRSPRLGWNIPGFSAPLAATIEKEVRYLMRSGPMLLTLVMPVFMLFIFRFGAMNPSRSGSLLAQTPVMAFPAAAAYTLLMLTNLAYNNFGADGGGIQFFFASPVRFREIVVAKNLAHTGVLVLEMTLAWIAVCILYAPPRLDITVATLAGLLFAAPVNFSAGNILSLYSPKKVDYSAFGRQRASQMIVLISLAVQISIIVIGMLAFWFARHYGSIWIATLILLALAVISFSVYRLILDRIDGFALARRETLVAELCRA
jgi:ABC-2 type transport system permease protein